MSSDMKHPVLYIVLNGELEMSAGKAAAQAVHAAMLLENAYTKHFDDNFKFSYKRTVVVLEAKNSEQMKNLYTYLQNAGIFANYYVDEGVNEVDAFSLTALAVAPIEHDDSEKREIFADFPLFGKQKRWWQ